VRHVNLALVNLPDGGDVDGSFVGAHGRHVTPARPASATPTLGYILSTPLSHPFCILWMNMRSQIQYSGYIWNFLSAANGRILRASPNNAPI
jgi:hypothetical protein